MRRETGKWRDQIKGRNYEKEREKWKTDTETRRKRGKEHRGKWKERNFDFHEIMEFIDKLSNQQLLKETHCVL